MRCPFCFAGKDEGAPVCPTCNRDTAIPVSLKKEHEDLLRKRDLLRADLVAKEALLKSKLSVRGRSSDA